MLLPLRRLAAGLVVTSASLVLSSTPSAAQTEPPPAPPVVAPLPAPAPAPAPAAAPVVAEGDDDSAARAPVPASSENDAPPDAPRERGPHRQGFTLELGIGASFTHVGTEGASQSWVGLAPLSLSIGGFVTPNVALLARIAGTSFFENNGNGDTTQFVNGFYGAHVQIWLSDRLMISGGPGFTLFGENPYFGGGSGAAKGYGASFRVGYGMLAVRHHSLRIAAEIFPSKYDDGFVMGTALNLEWQYF